MLSDRVWYACCYEEYSQMVDTITLRFLIGLNVYKILDMYHMDVVTVYLYGSLDIDLYENHERI